MLKILYTLFQQQTDPLKRLPAAETSYLLNISLPQLTKTRCELNTISHDSIWSNWS